MEWLKSDGDRGEWWELTDRDAVLATAWEAGGCGWWAIGDTWTGGRSETLDDAKDAAWAAVYRSTR